MSFDERTTTVGYRPDGTSTVSRRIAGNLPGFTGRARAARRALRPPDWDAVLLYVR